jgi:hypothetical protein
LEFLNIPQILFTKENPYNKIYEKAHDYELKYLPNWERSHALGLIGARGLAIIHQDSDSDQVDEP